MRIIDILNKIANGEELPKKFKYGEATFELEGNGVSYTDQDGDNLTRYICYDYSNLNDEVEIIEEKPEPIEELKLVSFEEFKTMTPGERYRVTIAEYDRINKLIKAVNYLLEKDNNG